jgi:putative adenylate-forming enzyme
VFDDFETRNFLIFFLLCKFRFHFWSSASIKNYQTKKLRETVAYATKYSKFFPRHYAGKDLLNVWELPTMNKKIMMENLSDCNTVGFTKEDILEFCLEVEKSRDFTKRYKGINIGMSSGTSGNKGVEIVTPHEESYMKAALFARFDFKKKKKINLAFILRVSAPAFNLDKFGHKLTYISQLNTIGEISKQLMSIQPNVISAPPSMLKIIGKEVELGRLKINPKKLIAYAEVLHSDVKDYLEKVFQCKVHQIYKCTEGPIAISCKYGSLHINEDLVAVETYNKDWTPTNVGQPCHKLIVSDLHKRAQPIIRYELNDIITISPNKCKCGSSFRVIEEIQGRADDIFWAKNLTNHEWQFIFPDYISRAIITASDEIDDFQAIQNAPDSLSIRIKLQQGISEQKFNSKNLITNINRVFTQYNCPLPKIEIIFGYPVANPNSNKLIRIHRNFTLY